MDPIFCCRDLPNKRIIRYSAWDWLDAHVFLQPLPCVENKIEKLRKINTSSVKMKLDSKLVCSHQFINNEFDHWVTSRLFAKLNPTCENKANEANEQKKLNTLIRYMSLHKTGYILALGTAIPRYLAYLPFSISAQDKLINLFYDKNSSWISGVLISEDWRRWFPEYYEDGMSHAQQKMILFYTEIPMRML